MLYPMPQWCKHSIVCSHRNLKGKIVSRLEVIHFKIFPYLYKLKSQKIIVEDKEEENKSPWRHHPLFGAYNKFYQGKNVLMGRIIAVVIAIVIIIIIIGILFFE